MIYISENKIKIYAKEIIDENDFNYRLTKIDIKSFFIKKYPKHGNIFDKVWSEYYLYGAEQPLSRDNPW